jgi:hypothetical protein
MLDGMELLREHVCNDPDLSIISIVLTTSQRTKYRGLRFCPQLPCVSATYISSKSIVDGKEKTRREIISEKEGHCSCHFYFVL